MDLKQWKPKQYFVKSKSAGFELRLHVVPAPMPGEEVPEVDEKKYLAAFTWDRKPREKWLERMQRMPHNRLRWRDV